MKFDMRYMRYGGMLSNNRFSNYTSNQNLIFIVNVMKHIYLSYLSGLISFGTKKGNVQ